MPYKIRKLPNKDLYKVSSIENPKHVYAYSIKKSQIQKLISAIEINKLFKKK
jgi:hypothetical protein